QRARAAVLRDQQIALRARLRQLSLELIERAPQRVDLLLLVVDLRGIALGQSGEALDALERGAGQVVLLLVDRQLGLFHPFGGLVRLLRLLLLEQVVIGHRDRHLRFHLQQLVLHVEDHLLDHLLRVLRAVDQVVEVRADERCDAVKYCHWLAPLQTPAGGRFVLSPIFRTFDSRSAIGVPESASNSAGTCAAISVMSPVSLCMPLELPLPVETMVILSTLLSGAAMACMISGSEVSSLSMTAAWLYSWNASAFTFIARASASPFLKMMSASASPRMRVADAAPSASIDRRLFSASASTEMRCRSTSACFSTVAISSFSRRTISASCTLICCSRSICCTRTASATTCCCITLVWIS